MKAINLFKTMACAAVVMVSVMGNEVKAQDNSFITNDEVKNELVVAKTIFKKDGAQLYRHIRYEFAYNASNQLIAKTAYKWNETDEKWMPHFQMTYVYNENEVTMSYALWNNQSKTYNKDIQKSIYELNAENIPTA